MLGPGVDDLDDPVLVETNKTFINTESSWGKTYSHTSIVLAASYIRFPQNAEKIEACRRVVSGFGMALDRLLGDSGGSWTIESQTLDYTSQDVEAIQYAYNFGSACTSLFSHMVDSAQCGTTHQARLNLSGFKGDQLRMHIDTCQETGWVSALFTQ